MYRTHVAGVIKAMNHNEAMQHRAAERYLLNELSPEERDAYEAHVFECQDCALDLRAASAFVDEAKIQLPALSQAGRTQPAPSPVRPARKPWFSWVLTPSFAAPVFAALLLVIGYQNLSTIPGLRASLARPRISPWSSVHLGSRSAAPVQVLADRTNGVTLLIDLPEQSGYVSYSSELIDADGKRVWKSDPVAATETNNGTMSVSVPGQGLTQGAYTLAISGILPSGETTEIGRRALAIAFGG